MLSGIPMGCVNDEHNMSVVDIQHQTIGCMCIIEMNIVSRTMRNPKHHSSKLIELIENGESTSIEVLQSSLSQVYKMHFHTDRFPGRKILLFSTQAHITEHHKIA
jgi:hypothetical protein